MHPLPTRRSHRVIATCAIVFTTACGAIVGVNADLTAPPDKEKPDTSSDDDDTPDVVVAETSTIDLPPEAGPPEEAGPDASCPVKSITRFPRQTFQNDNNGSLMSWQNANKALTQNDDGMQASAVPAGSSPSPLTAFFDFNPPVPANAIKLIGLRVDFRGKSNTPNFFTDKTVSVRVKDADPAIQSAEHANEHQDEFWPGDNAYSVRSYGGPTTRWLGDNLTLENVNKSDFAVVYGLARKSSNGFETIFHFLDVVTITVFYCDSE